VTEGEHLALNAITKEQSGSYECIASNDISSPDVRTVQVTVNCKDQNDHSHSENRIDVLIMTDMTDISSKKAIS